MKNEKFRHQFLKMTDEKHDINFHWPYGRSIVLLKIYLHAGLAVSIQVRGLTDRYKVEKFIAVGKHKIYVSRVSPSEQCKTFQQLFQFCSFLGDV